MELHGKTLSRRRGIGGGAAAKKATNSRASALVPTVRKLKRKGFISQRGLADELNRKGDTGAPWRQMASNHRSKDAKRAWA